jgi:uncharacterized protein YukE
MLAPMSALDVPLMRNLAARAELAGEQLRQTAATTLAQIASVRWQGQAAKAFDDNLGALLALVRRTSDDLDRFADALRRELTRTGAGS